MHGRLPVTVSAGLLLCTLATGCSLDTSTAPGPLGVPITATLSTPTREDDEQTYLHHLRNDGVPVTAAGDTEIRVGYRACRTALESTELPPSALATLRPGWTPAHAERALHAARQTLCRHVEPLWPDR